MPAPLPVPEANATRHRVKKGQPAKSYDRSRIQDSGEVVLSVVFAVTPGATPEMLRAAARTSLAFRKRTQPLHQSSAGCIFQNPGFDAVVPAGGRRFVARGEDDGYQQGCAARDYVGVESAHAAWRTVL